MDFPSNNKWGIQRRVVTVGGHNRVQFVTGSGDSTKLLKCRSDVVLFLSKNKNVELHLEQFCFKHSEMENISEDREDQNTRAIVFEIDKDPSQLEPISQEDSVNQKIKLNQLSAEITLLSGQLEKAVKDQKFLLAQECKNRLDQLKEEQESIRNHLEEEQDVLLNKLTSEVTDWEMVASETTNAVVDPDEEVNNSAVAQQMEENIPAQKKLKVDTEFEEKIEKIKGGRVGKQEPCEEYEKILQKLHTLRLKNSFQSSGLSSSAVLSLKNLLTNLKIDDDPLVLAKEILKNEELANAVESLLHTNIETEIELISLKDCKSVSMTFPVDQGENFYCSIIEEALVKMPKLLNLIISVVESDSDNLTPSFAIKIAVLIVEFLNTKDKRHSALKKINTLHVMFQKSSVSNLKTFGQKGFCAGHTEATRLVEEMSELSDYFKASQYTRDTLPYINHFWTRDPGYLRDQSEKGQNKDF